MLPFLRLNHGPQGARSTHTLLARVHRRINGRSDRNFLCSPPHLEKGKYLAVQLLGTSEAKVPIGAQLLKGEADEHMTILHINVYWEDRGVGS